MDIALIFDDKKTKKPEFVQLLVHLEKTQKSVFRINPDEDIAEQTKGKHFDVLLMKTTHLRAREDRTALERVVKFCKDNPKMAVVDPIESTEVFTKRSTLWARVRELDIKSISTPGIKVIETKEDIDESLCPCICKPDNAESHQLTLCHTKEDFDKVAIYPTYCEHLVPHKVLHKVYVVGDKLFIHPRSSIGDIPSGTTTFDSQTLTAQSHDEISELTTEDKITLENFMHIIGEGLGISLYGFDIVKEEGTGALVCIDINLFPGYASFPHFPETVVELLEQAVIKKTQ